MSETIHREFVVPQTPDEVWAALTDSESLADWMYPNDFEPRVGHRFTFEVPGNPAVHFDGLTVQCEVVECDPPRRLAFTWEAGPIVGTQVSYRLEPEGEGTRVVFEHAGFDTASQWGKQAFGGAKYGWAKMHKDLCALLDRP